LTDEECSFAHEAGVYIPSTGEVFITSNQYRPPHLNGKKHIHVSRFWKDPASGQWKVEKIDPAQVLMGNGGVNYKDGVLFCAQGGFTNPGGLVYMSRQAPYDTKLLLSNYHGRWFNSINDVVVHSDGSIWFTDPTYAFEQGLKPRPQLPCQVYRFDPSTGDVRAVADGFGKPNGLCFSPDEKTLYVTDTNAQQGDGLYKPHAESSM
jgi:gluconolactonase